MIDLVIVFIYLSLLLILTIKHRDKTAKFRGFSRISGQKLQQNRLILIATIFASAIGGGTSFGISEKAFADNLSYSYGLFLAIICDLAIAYFLVPKLVQKHQKAQTIGDIMQKTYGAIGRYVGGGAAILVSIGLVSAQISVSGRIFEYILQINYVYGIIISYGVIVIYTTIGGFKSVLFANKLQFFAIILAIPIISLFGLYEVGLAQFVALVPLKKISVQHNPELVKASIAAALGFAVMNLFPTFIQRAIINKDSQATAKAIYIKSVIFAIFLIFVTINGLLAAIIFPSSKASLALPRLIDHIIPVGVQGFVIAGLLASVMSTADSDLNIISVTLVKDFCQPLLKINNQTKMLLIARMINFFAGSLSIIIALYFEHVADLVIFIAGFWAPVILPALIFSLYDLVIGKRQFLIVACVGAFSFLIWEIYFASAISLKSVFVGFVANLSFFLFFYFYNYLTKENIDKQNIISSSVSNNE